MKHLALALLAVALGCASTKVAPLSAPSGYEMEADEAKLAQQGDELESRLRREGRLLQDPELESYVTAVGGRLVPAVAAQRVRFHFVVLRDPSINAFALSQGGIFVHTGLLARLENEAQLAHILGHEITHVVQRHQLRFTRSLQNKTVAAKLVQVVLVPAAGAVAGGGGADLASLLIGLTHAATVTGYGRAEEREADMVGARAMAAAGYRVDEAPRVFELLTELEDPGSLENFFYGSHPANRERAEYLHGLVASGEVGSRPDPLTNAEAYLARTAAAARENIGLRIAAGHPHFALDEVSLWRRRRGDAPEIDALEGDALYALATDPEQGARELALRQRRREPDRATIDRLRSEAGTRLRAAEAAYRRALEAVPALAAAHRGLGLALLAQGSREEGRAELRRYLELTPNALDRRGIERRLTEETP